MWRTGGEREREERRRGWLEKKIEVLGGKRGDNLNYWADL